MTTLLSMLKKIEGEEMTQYDTFYLHSKEVL